MADGLDTAPTVSVVMAVRNAERHVREAVDSILGQTFEDFELIIIDDGSTDRTWDVINSYSDSRLRTVHREHQGLVRSLNTGISLARGKYMARMDGDDVAEPERLAAQVSYLDAHPETVLVSSYVVFIDEQGISLGGPVAIPRHDEELRRALYRENPFSHSATTLRIDALRRVAGYRQAFETSEDYDLWLRMNEIGELSAIARPLIRVRLHAASKTSREGSQVLRFALLARSLAGQRLSGGRDTLGYIVPSGTATRLALLASRPIPDHVSFTDWGRRFQSAGKYKASAGFAVRGLVERPSDLAAWSLLVRACLISIGARRLYGFLKRSRTRFGAGP